MESKFLTFFINFPKGARENVHKIIFLLTDGNQHPTVKNGQIFDPVQASQNLVDRGAKIFVIGTKADLNISKLVAIARREDQVKIASRVEELVTDEFVQSVAEKACDVSK